MPASSNSSQSSLSRHGMAKADSTTNNGRPVFRPFYDTSREAAIARATYLKIFCGASFAIILLIFAVFSIFWGALWKIPVRNLQGWVVDFDGGVIGKSVVDGLNMPSSASKVTWSVVPVSDFPGGPSEVGGLVLEEHTWVAITINEGSSSRLSQSLVAPNATYDGSEAVSIFAVEARNENALQQAQGSLNAILQTIATQTAQQIANSTNLSSLLTISPQTLVTPVSYQIQNLAPFNVPLATAVTFVGLIYQLILSFFIVMISNAAREGSGLDKTLPTRSLIILRLVSSFIGYLVISVRSYGLALESLMTLLTVKGIPFFMITWIISNVSVCIFPIEVMPVVFRYGYAAPFYNVSRAMRTIVFGTKNTVGESFGILLVWIAISCTTLPLIQIFVRRKAAAVTAAQSHAPEPFSRSFWGKGDVELAKARTIYLKTVVPGVILVAITILAVFSIFWGSAWKIPDHSLPGWIVDFDGGQVGQFVMENLRTAERGAISWEVVPSSRFRMGLSDLKEAVQENGAWVAVVVNADATSRLESSVANPNASYNGAEAITIYGNEARNENAYRNILRPSVEASVHATQLAFAVQFAESISSNSNIASILATSPQTIVNPISFTTVNLVPFSQPVAIAALSTGLIFVLIMSYFVVMIANGARQASGLLRLLSLKSLIALRLGTSFIAYFFLAASIFIFDLIYSFVNLAFKLDLGHKFGHAGFVLFWIVSWIYMLAVGLALESLITVMKQFVPFFLIIWIVINVSANSYPIEVLPKIFHYGYATPFYNLSKAIRTIVFGTKNTLGLNIGVLLAWALISCATLVGLQWFVRQKDVEASFSRSLFEKGDKELADARVAYAKKLGVGMLLVALEILAVFSIFWGSLWRVPAHLLSGWIVDFDGGIVGQFVAENLKAEQATTIVWEVVSPSRFQGGLDDLKKAVVDNGAWVAVVVNDGATARLSNSTANPNPAYNGEEAVTVYADEARNENAFFVLSSAIDPVLTLYHLVLFSRNLVRPSVSFWVFGVSLKVSDSSTPTGGRVDYVAQVIQSPNFDSIVQTSPQTIVDPVSFTVVNLVPFSQPVATAALSTGLIFLLIMSNFIVTIASNARQTSGIPRLLSLRSIVALRLGSSFVAYFFLSPFASWKSVYGRAGFFLFWAISWIYMLAVGLALESLLTVLKQYLSFFMTMWIVVNTSTNSNPLEVLPKIFHYGYAMPFYNFSKAVRTIVFGTRDTSHVLEHEARDLTRSHINPLGLNIGVLLAWILVSCVTLTGFQWSQRRRDVNEMRKKAVKEPVPKPKETDDLAGEQKEKEEV
ncbi:hypothetical protein CVT25_011941 [Psilocybe cyanescens]|uniref:DUF3533 domain-containing protein n=1 Tax=Psilocybe cyanescens TaxID=93625 RepID=A0A409XQH6_PSICY|nr:hypothetical protein CVT25_011941 [Psilocybe cyanescens]